MSLRKMAYIMTAGLVGDSGEPPGIPGNLLPTAGDLVNRSTVLQATSIKMTW